MKVLVNYSFVLILIFSIGCTKDITEFNDNVKSPTTVPASSLFANSIKELVDYVASPNVNVNTFRLWTQHWTQTTYVDESNYELTERNVNGEVMQRMYARVLRDVKEARGFVDADEVLTAEVKSAQLACLDVIEAYAYSVLVDVFGDVPYSEALQGVENLSPVYDNDSDIYASIISDLSAAVTALKASTSMGEFAGSDLLYGGSTSSWAMFAASLKLRLAMRMADVSGSNSQSLAESVVSDVFTSNGDHAALMYQTSTPNTNPLWEDLVQSGRTDYIASNTLGDIMNATNDPRRAMYFRNNGGSDSIVGNPHGAGGAYPDFSQPGDALEDPTHPGVLLSYAEVEFHLADAANRGWTTPSTADVHYGNAVSASIIQWGGVQADADAFLLEPAVAWSAANADELIGTQKWVAMYDQGLEAWSTWRMYDFPAMNIAAEAGTIPPYRYNYSVDEYSVNGTNVAAANSGNDALTSKVFWDVD